MQRINTADGNFHAGDPSTGALGTIVTSDYMQSLQEEVAGAVEGASITLDPGDNGQLLKAIRRLVQSPPLLADSGAAANVYAAANSPALTAATWANGVTQRVLIAHTNTGASTYSPDGLAALPIYGLGLTALQGGELLVGGTAVLMKATVAGVNSGNAFCLLISCGGGSLQIPPAVKDQHAVQFGQLTGSIGSRTTLKGSCVAGATSITLAIEGLVVGTSLTGLQGVVSGSLTLDLTKTGADGIDAGTATAGSWLAVYAFKNPTTGAQCLVGQVFAAAGVPTTVYGGANAPVGYTMSALATVVQVSGTVGQLAAVRVNGRRVSRGSGTTFTSSTATTTPTAIALSGACPGNAVRIAGEMAISATATASVGFSITADTVSGIGGQNQSGSVGTAGGIGNFQIDLLVQQIVYYTGNVSTGTPTYSLIVTSFEF